MKGRGKRQRFSKMAISDLQGKGEGSRVDLSMSTCLHFLTHSHADLVSDTRNLASFEISAYSRNPTNIPTHRMSNKFLRKKNEKKKKKTSRKCFDKHTHRTIKSAFKNWERVMRRKHENNYNCTTGLGLEGGRESREWMNS